MRGLTLLRATRTRWTGPLATTVRAAAVELTPLKSRTRRGGGSFATSAVLATSLPLPVNVTVTAPPAEEAFTDFSDVAVATGAAGWEADGAFAEPLAVSASSTRTICRSARTRCGTGRESFSRTRASAAPSTAVASSTSTDWSRPPGTSPTRLTAPFADAWRRSTSTVSGSGRVAT